MPSSLTHARERRKRTPLSFLVFFVPFMAVIFIATRFGPKILSHPSSPQNVRFSTVWFSIQNSTSTDWTGGTVTLNGTYSIPLPKVASLETVQIPYTAFTNGITLG